mmetsp:Transcript_2934/g.6659  ORF Transcript_2934/g.6659 Transcript_2934/m.6659 type:complete len:215 (-) Transcript_2934:154-798(-)
MTSSPVTRRLIRPVSECAVHRAAVLAGLAPQVPGALLCALPRFQHLPLKEAGLHHALRASIRAVVLALVTVVPHLAPIAHACSIAISLRTLPTVRRARVSTPQAVVLLLARLAMAECVQAPALAAQDTVGTLPVTILGLAIQGASLRLTIRCETVALKITPVDTHRGARQRASDPPCRGLPSLVGLASRTQIAGAGVVLANANFPDLGLSTHLR